MIRSSTYPVSILKRKKKKEIFYKKDYMFCFNIFVLDGTTKEECNPLK